MLPKHLLLREASLLPADSFRCRYHVTEDLVKRLGLDAELAGHQGCVNCLQWSRSGDLLMSGSDDLKVNLWDPHRKKLIKRLDTKHVGNIFSVKFLPFGGDSVLASGAADFKIHVMDANKGETIQSFGDHCGRVKRLDVSQADPHLLWSAAEDGTVMQMDLRCDSNQALVLVNLNGAMGKQAEAKCLSVNPVRSELIAVGANDPYVRLYDRRMIKPQQIPQGESGVNGVQSSLDRKHLLTSMRHIDLEDENYAAQYLVAGHLPVREKHYRKKLRSLTSTYVTFSPDGSELLVNLGGEQIYLFSLTSPEVPLLKEELGPLTTCNESNPNWGMKSAAETLKGQANVEYDSKQYSKAICLYNKALLLCRHPILFSNRAAASMKRNWDGDMYSALRDCQTALKMDPTYVKAHLRSIRCLMELDLLERSRHYLKKFRDSFPEHCNASPYRALESEVKEKIAKQTKDILPDQSPEASRLLDVSDSGSSVEENLQDVRVDCTEIRCRDEALDYSRTFCGHCNTTTDIKEASFFGSDGQFITAGSDDGKFFIWEKSSSNIIRIFHGDESIVNCLQCHPNICLLASSGIDPVVRLWTPFPENGKENDRVVSNSENVAVANQRRMNEDPFETLLLNMGYEIGDGGRDDNDNESIQCRTS